MGAITNLRPDLFAAVVAEVPFVDCLTTILDDTLPLTVTEWEEWGNPVEDPEVYDYMKGYSPYDNVDAQRLPDDPRHRRAQRPPRVVLGAGQVGADAAGAPPRAAARSTSRPRWAPATRARRGRYDAWKDEAFVFAFILDALGLSLSELTLARLQGHPPTHERAPGRDGPRRTRPADRPASIVARPVGTSTSSPRRTTADARLVAAAGPSASGRPTIRAGGSHLDLEHLHARGVDRQRLRHRRRRRSARPRRPRRRAAARR